MDDEAFRSKQEECFQHMYNLHSNKETASQRGLFNPGGESSSDNKSLERSWGERVRVAIKSSGEC